MTDAPKTGRPSLYRPEYCERVEAFMAGGFSKLAAAGDIGVCYNTLKAWMDEQPEFLTAVKRGEAKRAMKLERDLLDAEAGPKVTSRIFALKNAAPDEWKDKQEVDTRHALADPLAELFASIAAQGKRVTDGDR